MAVLQMGMRFEHPSASSGKPHILSYTTARSVADDALFEVWNGSTDAARVLRLNKDGQVQLQQGTAGAPVLAPEGDKDTGVYFVTATPEVAVAVAGTKRLSVVAAGVAVTGTLTSSGAVLPSASDGAALGSAALMWSDVFLASGAVLNFDNGDVTVTHAANALTIAGGSVTFGSGVTVSGILTTSNSILANEGIIVGSTKTIAFGGGPDYTITHSAGLLTFTGALTIGGAFLPSANDGAALGASGTAWSDVFLAAGAVLDFGAGSVTLTHSAGQLAMAGGSLVVGGDVILSGTPQIFLNDTENAQQDVGITINEGAAQQNAIALKSSSVAHGRLTVGNGVETDDYFVISRLFSGEGGAHLMALAEDAAVTRVLHLEAIGGTASTTHTTAGVGLITLNVAEHDGANNGTVLAADSNIFVVRASDVSKFLVDAEGDFFYDGADGGAFDSFDDTHLLRAFALATSKPGDIVRSQWDEWLQYNERHLVEIGVLGAPVAQGGLVNGAQLNRVMVGAIWQLQQQVNELRAQLA